MHVKVSDPTYVLSDITESEAKILANLLTCIGGNPAPGNPRSVFDNILHALAAAEVIPDKRVAKFTGTSTARSVHIDWLE